MRKLVASALFLGLMLASPAFAGDGKGSSKIFSDGKHSWNGKGLGHTKGVRGSSGKVPPGHVPELDPGLLGSAAVLLIGGTLVLQGRRRIEPEG